MSKRLWSTSIPLPSNGTLRRARTTWWADLLVFVALGLLLFGIVEVAARWTAPRTEVTPIELTPFVLPLYALYSLARMVVAYALSLGFGLVYGSLLASSRSAERILSPVLDILQSIPILSFLPGVVLALVALFPARNIGLELAAIVLIFTCQAWNLAFCFYQSQVSVPRALREAASVFRLTRWQRFTRLALPFATIPLVWNSMMSWANGWFFLMASEQFALGEQSFQLPGIGSFIAVAAEQGNLRALGLGLLTMLVVIVGLDLLLWRPLLSWAERFRVEDTAGTSRQPALVSLWLQRSRLLAWLSDTALPPVWRVLERAMNSLLGEGTAASTPGQQTGSPTRRARSVRLLTFAGLGVASVWGIGTLGQALLRLPIDAWAEIGRGTVLSFLRVTTALLITVAWTVPVGVAIGMNPRWAPRVQALLQLVASFPATALFPAVVLVVIALPGGSQLAALLLLLLGTQWYVLFNVIAGAMAIPNELREAAALAQLSGWQRWRLLILPGIYPSLVTGLITAAGGAWNATIVAEYVTFQGAAYSAGGLGSVIAASAEAGDYGLLFAATLTMVALVVTLNRVFWGRLYRLVSQRFRLD